MCNNKSYFEEIQEKYKMESIIYNPMNFCEDGLYIFFSSKRTYHRCNNCKSNHTIVHDYTDKTIRGGTMNGVPIYLNLRHCRYLCKECNSTFMEQFDYLSPYKVMTIEAENYIISKLGSLSFFELSCDIGVSIQTIVNRAKDFGAQERIEKLAGHYRYLSMDEVFISRNEKGEAQYYWLLNDNSIRWKSNNIRIDIGRNKDDVIKRLKELKNKDDVIGVSIDMWKPYRDAISEVFPNALIVIDPFHLIKTAESAMDSVRKGLECPNLIKLSLKKDAKLFLSSIYKLTNDELDRLESYLKLDPKLEKSYFIVQELLEFYWIRDHEDALEYIAEWEKRYFAVV